MRFLFFSYLCFLCLALHAQSRYTTRQLLNGRFKNDSSYIYSLPFETGKKVFLIQGYETIFSHKGERSLDFKIRKGTTICAARAGVVTAVRQDSDKGGLKPENLADGNYIIIQHNDSSTAWYWHLKKKRGIGTGGG